MSPYQAAAPQACALTGNRTGDPLVHRAALNPLNHTSQGWLPTCFKYNPSQLLLHRLPRDWQKQQMIVYQGCPTMNSAQHKILSLLKIFFLLISFCCVCVFNVWPKTTLLPVWPGDAKRLAVPNYCIRHPCWTERNCWKPSHTQTPPPTETEGAATPMGGAREFQGRTEKPPVLMLVRKRSYEKYMLDFNYCSRIKNAASGTFLKPNT